MAVVLQEIVDSDFEYFVKITTTGTNSGSSVYDASAAAGATGRCNCCAQLLQAQRNAATAVVGVTGNGML